MLHGEIEHLIAVKPQNRYQFHMIFIEKGNSPAIVLY
jgi:hypothetical protein